MLLILPPAPPHVCGRKDPDSHTEAERCVFTACFSLFLAKPGVLSHKSYVHAHFTSCNHAGSRVKDAGGAPLRERSGSGLVCEVSGV